ncbi:MAG TPA: four helix bundle protein [Candidatus Nitrosotenuis sp.]|nr:four helix bundle protein [Candidatus Nitrosotenuis sp.]
MIAHPDALRERSKKFALRVIKLVQSLPRTVEAKVIGRQILRSATSVAANYRAVCRARSRAEFVARLGIVLEEADETHLWLELLGDAGIVKPDLLSALKKEANELVLIFSASIRTAKRYVAAK